ncbi:MAG: hypothetical protein KF708_08710 [Pirellulales bacterium]|nr:hypothetical protein [Pirellulales bacterium]
MTALLAAATTDPAQLTARGGRLYDSPPPADETIPVNLFPSTMNSTSYTGLALLLCGLLACAGGCAAVKATQQPDKRDMKVLYRGVPRTHVIAELGAPVWSDVQQGQTVDVFAFKQGYTKANKAARALVHGAADVATFGLWEVVGIPAEAIADGTDVQLEVHYNPDQTVARVVVIKGEKAVNPPEPFAFASKANKGDGEIPIETPAIHQEPAPLTAGEAKLIR